MKTKARLMASFKIGVVIYPSITLFLYLFGERLPVLHLDQRLPGSCLLAGLSLRPSSAHGRLKLARGTQ